MRWQLLQCLFCIRGCYGLYAAERTPGEALRSSLRLRSTCMIHAGNGNGECEKRPAPGVLDMYADVALLLIRHESRYALLNIVLLP